MIVSASRRTDIPAFYSRWFYRRLEEGFVVTRNPFNASQLTKIRLDADVVDAIVLWTKNPAPMLDRLDELDARGIPYYFQFTITPYGRDLEPRLPADKAVLVETFRELARRLGPERVIWRYDPILFGGRYSRAFHERTCRAYRPDRRRGRHAGRDVRRGDRPRRVRHRARPLHRRRPDRADLRQEAHAPRTRQGQGAAGALRLHRQHRHRRSQTTPCSGHLCPCEAFGRTLATTSSARASAPPRSRSSSAPAICVVHP